MEQSRTSSLARSDIWPCADRAHFRLSVNQISAVPLRKSRNWAESAYGADEKSCLCERD